MASAKATVSFIASKAIGATSIKQHKLEIESLTECRIISLT